MGRAEPLRGPSARSRRRVRVAVDLTALSDRTDGGARTLALELVRSLPRLAPRWQFLLLTAPGGTPLPGLRAPNVRRCCVRDGAVETAPSWHSWATPVGLVRRLAALLRRSRGAGKQRPRPLLRGLGVDVLLCPLNAPSCHDPTHHDPTVPTVAVLSDLVYQSYPELYSGSERGERDRAFREALHVASRIVCVSENVRQKVLQDATVDPRRVRTVPAGVTGRLPALPARAVARVLARYGLTREKFLLCPAGHAPHHNVEMLLTAFGIYRNRHPGSDLRLVLGGPDWGGRRDVRQAVCRMGLEAHVVLAGDVSDRERSALLRSCAALVCPSLYEEFGIPLLEARACGRPILCSNVCGLPEVAGDAAILFDPRKPAEIVGALERLECGGSDPARCRGRAGPRTEGAGGVERMARDYLRLLREALRDPVPPHDCLHGVHADGWTADRFFVTFRPGESPRRLRLTLQAPPVAGPAGASVRFRINGQAGEEHPLSRDEPREVRYSLPPEGGHVEAVVEPPFRPAEHGFGPDGRVLGCLCTGCRLTDAVSDRDLLEEAVQRGRCR